MADQKASALTADASPTTDDIVYVVNDPGGTPASRKVTLSNLRTLMEGNAALKANNLSDLASASTARTNLGLGTIATQAANSVAITGGSVTGITDITIADGGTGASTAAGARTNLQITSTVPAYRSGVWYWGDNLNGTSTGAAVTAGRLYAVPIRITESVTATKIATYVTTGVAATNVRFGIYENSSGVPGNRIIDGGEASTATTNTTPEVTISQALTPGWYFLAMVFNGTPSIRTNTVIRNTTLGATGLNVSGISHFYVAHTYGALPASFGTPTADSQPTIPVIALQF